MDFTTSLVTISSSLKKRVPVQKCNLSADVIQVNVWKIKLSIPFFFCFSCIDGQLFSNKAASIENEALFFIYM